METKANYVAVGAFVLACALGLVIAALWLASVQYSQEYAYYQTNFRGPVTGLGKGTTVRYNGIEVGHVADLHFDYSDPQVVVAVLQVQPNLGIRTDSVSSIEPQGLTGGSYVEISGGSKDSPVLVREDDQNYPLIKSAPSALQKLTAGAPELMAKLNAAVDRLNNVLSDRNQEAFTHILANLDTTTNVLARHTDQIEDTLGDLNKASKALPVMLADADLSVKRLGKLSGDADSFVTGNATSQITALMSDTRRLVVSLTKLSDKLNSQPTELLFGNRRKGYTPP